MPSTSTASMAEESDDVAPEAQDASQSAFMGPLGLALGGLGEIKDKYMTSLLISDERDNETEVVTLANMAGNNAPAIVTKAAPFKSKVGMTRSSLTATADDGRMSP